jgi:hypothetical protein
LDHIGSTFHRRGHSGFGLLDGCANLAFLDLVGSGLFGDNLDALDG